MEIRASAREGQANGHPVQLRIKTGVALQRLESNFPESGSEHRPDSVTVDTTIRHFYALSCCGFRERQLLTQDVKPTVLWKSGQVTMNGRTSGQMVMPQLLGHAFSR